MIFDKVENASKYLGLNPDLDLALRHLMASTPKWFDGVTELHGNDSRVSCASFISVPASESFFEVHHNFGDVHVVLSGREKVFLAAESDLHCYEASPERDLYCCSGEAASSVLCTPGTFLVAFPGEGHLLKVMVDGPETVTKVVYKFKA